MKAVEFGQEYICFSFVIEDGKRVVNISEVRWRLLRLRKNFSFYYSTKVLAKAGPSADPIATPFVCLYIVLLKLNSIEDVPLFINSTNTSFGMTGCASDSS